ncbi:MAG: CCA tRNA nucleotidyltransferase [Fusobacterium sp.]|nr:CCA tRNA nucleotidyltransferase [Fusobacterium sp.]
MKDSKKEILDILKLLSKHSKAYIVGGYLRDLFLGIEPKDCDFSCALPLKKTIEIFSELPNCEIKIISEKLNIVKIKINDFNFEIARMREDLKYYSNRKDLDFTFTDDIKKDLLRRDFTVNSFAFDGKNLFYLNEKSISDLKNKNLSFIGNCETKIKEDPFRILRLFRFFSEKSFKTIDEENLKTIKKYKNLIWTLPVEMINSEFIKIIKGKNYLNTFKLINSIELFNDNFFIGDYEETYQERLKSLFKNSDLSLLKKLNFSKKILKKLEVIN